MQGDDPEFLEALRLIQKFFPESKSWLTEDVGLDWDSFVGAMQAADYAADYSCDAFRQPSAPVLGLSEQGGLQGRASEVFQRLLLHTGMKPAGRAVVVPDAIGHTGWSREECLPFICAAQTIPERLDEITFFGQSRDSLFVFESGEALLIDHHERVHWARSRINQRHNAL